MKIRCLILVLCCLSYSCLTSSSKEDGAFYDVCKQLSIPIRSNTFYLLIPTDGCGVCVKKAIKFSKENTRNSKLTVILVSTSGKKNAIISYGYSVSSNIYVDSKGVFINAKISNGYVSVVSLKDGEPIKIDIFEPSNLDAGLKNLHQKISF